MSNPALAASDADLSVTCNDGTTFAPPGTLVTYTIVVSNTGPANVTGAAVSCPLPDKATAAGWTFVGATGGGSVTGPYTGTGALDTTMDLPVGASVTFLFTVQIDLIATGALTTTVTVEPPAGVTDLNPGNDSATDTDALTQPADLTVTKTVSDPTPNVGDTIAFTVTLTNIGPNSATNVTVADSLPAGLTFVSSTSSQGSYAGGVWTVGDIATGASPTLVMQSKVISPSPLTNTATISHSDQFDLDTSNNTASATVTPQQANLSVTKTVSNPTPNVGDTITFTVTATNPGPNGATNVSVADALPAGLTLVSAMPSQGSYAGGVWTVGAIAAGASPTLVMQFKVISLSPSTNTAAISHSDQFDPNPANNTASATVAPKQAYTVAFNSQGGSSVPDINGVPTGSTILAPTAPTKAGYTFGGWYKESTCANPWNFSTDTVTGDIILYAKWTLNGGGVSADPAVPTYYAAVNKSNGSRYTLPVTVDNNGGSAGVYIDSQSTIMTGGAASVITVPSIPDVDTYTVGIPVPALSTTSEQGSLTLNTDVGSITISSNMLTVVAGSNGNRAVISIGKDDKTSLPAGVRAAIGDRPLIQLSMSIDGTHAEWNNPAAPVIVSIPYTPKAAELVNPDSIIVWYIDGSGKVVAIPNGHYDPGRMGEQSAPLTTSPATGTVTFSTTHFSYYAVGYNKVSFNDVAATALYYKAVDFIAARGITEGTGNGNYSPDAKLTRGDFLVMLLKACDIAPDTSPKDNFADAGNTYYTGYLAAAKRLGISTGVGNNLYAPGKDITRQEMFTLTYNVLKVVSQLPGTHGRAVGEADDQPQGDSGKKLSDFTDAGQVDTWAKDAMTLFVATGTLSGNGNKLTPKDTATRAEMAQVLYNLLKK